MKNRKMVGGLLAGASLALSGGVAQASPFLSVDLGNAGGPQQAGFQLENVTTGTAGPVSQSFPVSDPSGPETSVTLSIAATIALSAGGDFNSTNGVQSNDRSSLRTAALPTGSTFNQQALYEDFVDNANTGIELSNLNPSTSYIVSLYSYDFNASRTATFTDITTGSTNAPITVTNSAGTTDLTTNGVDTATFTSKSDSSGRLLFTETGSGVVVLNGLTVSAATPEPSSAIMLLMGAAPLLMNRRRRSGGAPATA